MNGVAAALGAALLAAALTVAGPVDAAETGVQKLVAAAIAGDRARVSELSAQLRSQSRPPRGNRHKARDLNERGLALWQRQRFEEAASAFRDARAADAGDVEIVENLGYALLKAGHVTEAEAALLDALALAPDRASAWGSLGMVYAKEGKHRAGVACVLTAYGYARDRKRTAAVYSRMAATDDDPKVRAMLAEVVSKLPGT